MSIAKKNLEEALKVLQEFASDEVQLANIEKAATLMVDAIKNGNKIISCGNGGSMSDAMHFAEELSGRFRDDRRALPAISISDPSHITCVGNDYGFDFIFSRFVDGVGKEGDVLLAISTSGNSKNIQKACDSAIQKGMKIVGLTGKDGGVLSGLSNVEIRAPKSDYADRAQEIHIKVIHSLIESIEKSLA
jgi:D-sedoheptulose 7-phosphate isomerase